MTTIHRRWSTRAWACALALASAACGCTTEGPKASPSALEPARSSSAPRTDRPSAPTNAAPASAAPAVSTATSAAAASGEAPAPLDRSAYPWLADSSLSPPAAVDSLAARFPAPAGYRRAPVASGTFGAWLRGLPLAPPGTPVVSYAGDVILPDGHPNLAAVVAVDVGSADLQQCADSVIRMHAEWVWSTGGREMSYRAASGTPMPFAKWARGERPKPSANGQSLQWEARAKPEQNGGVHASFRKYLDSVFMWANTVALATQATKIPLESARPGDFVIMPGNPGHAVLILDMAISNKGERVALLGQGFMPAQSFQVLRPSPSSAWFALDASKTGVKTPFWPEFPWDSLRRLDDAKAAPDASRRAP